MEESWLIPSVLISSGVLIVFMFVFDVYHVLV